MKRAQSFSPLFFFLFILCLLIFFFLQNIFVGPLQFITVPIQKWTYTTFTHMPIGGSESEEQLRAENKNLRTALANLQNLERENKSLQEQLKTSNPQSKNLLPATIIGSSDNQIFLDRGEADQIQRGDIVVVKDNLVGKVDKVSPHSSIVKVITHPSTSFTAQTAKTASIGVVKAQNDEGITLENVVLSSKLEKDDTVVTKGDIDGKGGGFPPQLVVGKIVSVNKKDSSLFQNAQVRSLIDFNRIQTVFVLVE